MSCQHSHSCAHGLVSSTSTSTTESGTSSSKGSALYDLVPTKTPDLSIRPQVSCLEVKEISKSETRKYLNELRDLMEQRADAYKTFETGFKLYRETKHTMAYQRLCQAMTEKFKDLSLQVIAIEKALITGAQTEWAKEIRRLQLLEQRKFKATAQLQFLHVKYLVLSDNPYDETYLDATDGLRSEIAEVVEELNEIVEAARLEVLDPDQESEEAGEDGKSGGAVVVVVVTKREKVEEKASGGAGA